MKEPKQDKYVKPPPKPNLKNKDFVKWSRAEMVKRDDNIVSSDWHEKLQKTGPFIPAYDNVPLNMVYLISGEYGRIWQKERDEWYASVFVLNRKEKDMETRKKKIQKEIREAKKAAEVNSKERRERRAKETEARAKAEAERLEKIRARNAKFTIISKPKKKKEKEVKAKESEQATPEQKQEGCPKGWTQVELTVQCECSSHQKEKESQNAEVSKKEELTQDAGQEQQVKEEVNQPTVCQDYIKQLQDIPFKKSKPKEVGTRCAKPEQEEKIKEMKPTLCPHCIPWNTCPYCMQNGQVGQKDLLPISARQPCHGRPDQDANLEKAKEIKPAFCPHCMTMNSCPHCMQNQKDMIPATSTRQPCHGRLEQDPNIEKTKEIKPAFCPHCMTSNSCPHCMQNQKDMLPTSTRQPCHGKMEPDVNLEKKEMKQTFCPHCMTSSSCPHCMQNQKDMLSPCVNNTAKEGAARPFTCPHCSLFQGNSKDHFLNTKHSKEGFAIN